MQAMIKKMMFVAVVAVLVAAPAAFADGGYGRGYGGCARGYGYDGPMMGPGYGRHMMGEGYGGYMMGPGYGRHMGFWGDRGAYGVSEEEADRLAEARTAFRKETRALREDIFDKHADIRRELAKQNPDRERVLGLQKELSELELQFDQKRLDFQLKLREIVPDAAGRRAGGFGPGAGGCWQ